MLKCVACPFTHLGRALGGLRSILRSAVFALGESLNESILVSSSTFLFAYNNLLLFELIFLLHSC